jgi:hypothetical protein
MAIACLLSACASSPVSSERAAPVPPERLVAFQTAISGPHGTIEVVRDSGFGGSGCYFGLFIDGVVAAQMGTAEKASFVVKSGEHVIGAAPVGGSVCGAMTQSNMREISIVVRDAETRKYRIGVAQSGDNTLQPTAF